MTLKGKLVSVIIPIKDFRLVLDFDHLNFEIVSDFGFRASDLIVALTNIAENLAKPA